MQLNKTVKASIEFLILAFFYKVKRISRKKHRNQIEWIRQIE